LTQIDETAGDSTVEQGALKVHYLVIRSPRPNRTKVTGKTGGWKQALNSLAMFYGERITGN
jgi:putative transposase